MSNYHNSCKKLQNKSPDKLKAFCDCKNCTTKDCPDILPRLGITVTEKSCDFGSKVDKGAKEVAEKSAPERSSLLDVISAERDCSCGVAARAVRSNVRAIRRPPASDQVNDPGTDNH